MLIWLFPAIHLSFHSQKNRLYWHIVIISQKKKKKKRFITYQFMGISFHSNPKPEGKTKTKIRRKKINLTETTIQQPSMPIYPILISIIRQVFALNKSLWKKRLSKIQVHRTD